MKIFLLCILSLATGSAATSQVTGKLRSSGGSPVESANTLLLKSADSSLVRAALSDETGSFQIQSSTPGRYFLRITGIGYQAWDSPAFELSAVEKNKDFGVLLLQTDTQQLKEVVIRSERPLIQVQPGGLILNAESSILSKGSSALSLLERSPGVQIDQYDHNISLNGKSGVTVSINGKLLRIPVQQLVTFLDGISADDIEKIELLSNPPAGADAEGNAGMINIVLKHSKKPGTNGSYSATAGYGWREKATGNLNLSHTHGKISLHGSYTFSHDRSYSQFHGVGLIDFPPMGGPASAETWSTNQPALNSHHVTGGLDYRLGPRITAGGAISYNSSRRLVSTTDHERFTVLPDSLLIFDGKARGTSRWTNLLSSLYLEKKINDGEQFSLDLDYIRYANQNPTNVQSSFVHPNGERAGTNNDTLFSPVQRGYGGTTIQVGVFKADYRKQLNSILRAETGFKVAATTVESLSGIESLVGSEWVGRSASSNSIRMNENVGALYISLTARISATSNFVTGARYEYSTTLFHQPGAYETLTDRKQGRLFPSMLFTKMFPDRSALEISFSKRIGRPTYNDLASFIEYAGPVAAYTGNSLLRPTITSNLKISYSWQGYSFSLLASRDDFPIVRNQLAQNPSRQLLYILPENLTLQDNVLLQATIPWKLNNWWNMNYVLLTGWKRYKEDFTIYPADKSWFSYSINFSQVFKLPKKYSIEISGWYNSFTYNGTTKIDGYGALQAGIKKELIKNRGAIQIAVTDILRTIATSGYHGYVTEEPFLIKNHFIYQTESARFPIFRISWTRSFGNEFFRNGRKEGNDPAEERQRISH